jgi:hypothetical protein
MLSHKAQVVASLLEPVQGEGDQSRVLVQPGEARG